MYYKYFEVFMHGRDPIIVTGKTRAQVGRDFKKIYGPDKVDEVKPISVRGAEARLGLDFKPIVKSNTMINTPNGKTPHVNEDYDKSLSNLETKDYGYYEISFVGTDETDIVMGSSYDEVHADMAQLYGDNLLEVTPIQPEEMVPAPDEDEPKRNHQTNISILTGRNPFAKGVAESTGIEEVSMDAIKKAITHPSGTGKEENAKQKDKLRAHLVSKKKEVEEQNFLDMTPAQQSAFLSKGSADLQAAHKAKFANIKNTLPTKEKQTGTVRATNYDRVRAQGPNYNKVKINPNESVQEDNLNEVSPERAKKVQDRAFDNMAKGFGSTKPNPKTGGKTNEYVPATPDEKKTAKKGAKAGGLAKRALDRNANKKRTGRYEAYGVSITSDMSIEEQSALIKMLPLAMQVEAMDALGLEEKRGLWDNIHAKRKRIKAGSGERMRKPGSDGAPSAKDLKDSQTKK